MRGGGVAAGGAAGRGPGLRAARTHRPPRRRARAIHARHQGRYRRQEAAAGCCCTR